MRGTPERTPGPAVAGLRRVRWVRVTTDAHRTQCEAVGIGYRRPVVRPIPLTTAARLISGGVPAQIRRGRGA